MYWLSRGHDRIPVIRKQHVGSGVFARFVERVAIVDNFP
jgi:hypothetical protein